jgi:Na+/melibiose symporter-like transporter
MGSGVLSFAYLHAISTHNVTLAFMLALLMWGIVYQGYNAVFPSFYPELFPTRTRVSGMAIAQNLGTMVSALLPALFVAVAPPEAQHIPTTIGAITLTVCSIAAIAAWSAREPYRIPLNELGHPSAVPVSKHEYERLRAGLLDAS